MPKLTKGTIGTQQRRITQKEKVEIFKKILN